MKLLSSLLLAFLFIFSSCSSKVYNPRLTGSYQDTPTVISTIRTFDQVWETIIDYFAQRGISISIIDKSSGLIIAKNNFSTRYWTYEESGKPKDPSAYVVINPCKLIQGYDFKEFHPERVEGEWNVRVKTVDNKTLVNVNLFIQNVKERNEMINGSANPCLFEARSTGIFEKGLAEIFAGK